MDLRFECLIFIVCGNVFVGVDNVLGNLFLVEFGKNFLFVNLGGVEGWIFIGVNVVIFGLIWLDFCVFVVRGYVDEVFRGVKGSLNFWSDFSSIFFKKCW